MKDDLKIRAVSAPWHQGVDFLIRNEAGQRFLVVPDPCEHNPGCAIRDSFTLETPAAQNLMDDLWMAGLRPTEGTGSAGAFAAQGRHLEDMRKLVFKGK